MSIRLFLFALFIIVLTACAAAPVSTPTPTAVATATPAVNTSDTPPTTAIGSFFALSVTDVNASAKWYSEKLDLKIVLHPPKSNHTTVIGLEGNGLIVELIQQDDAQSLSQAAPEIKDNILIHGIIKAGFIVEDFDRTVVLLKERQVDIVLGPYPARVDQRANVIINDNEGNLIQLFGNYTN